MFDRASLPLSFWRQEAAYIAAFLACKRGLQVAPLLNYMAHLFHAVPAR
jgi:hypothetical protein